MAGMDGLGEKISDDTLVSRLVDGYGISRNIIERVWVQPLDADANKTEKRGLRLPYRRELMLKVDPEGTLPATLKSRVDDSLIEISGRFVNNLAQVDGVVVPALAERLDVAVDVVAPCLTMAYDDPEDGPQVLLTYRAGSNPSSGASLVPFIVSANATEFMGGEDPVCAIHELDKREYLEGFLGFNNRLLCLDLKDKMRDRVVEGGEVIKRDTSPVSTPITLLSSNGGGLKSQTRWAYLYSPPCGGGPRHWG